MISETVLIYSLCIIGSLITCCAIYLIILNKQTKTSLYDLEQDEYDFLGSPDGIPSNLDLARAYIAMSQFNEAKTILKQIAQCHEASFQNEAKALLHEIAEA
tara:strand:+ start:30 stop:335 length:306 start_codon:yes stop_codon:yes gene_type:complete